jgi:AcrR family transcriptional regulator
MVNQQQVAADDDGRRTAGRPRDARIDDAVLRAALELLDETGYGALSIGAVAKRANVNRPAIYRRWPSLQHLVVDALAHVLFATTTPDTGDLRADLLAGMEGLIELLDDTAVGRVLPALVADLRRDPELAERFLRDIFHARRAATATTLRHAVKRGEVRDDIDLDFVLDALAAPIYYRTLFHHLPLNRRLAQQTVDLVLAAISNR